MEQMLLLLLASSTMMKMMSGSDAAQPATNETCGFPGQCASGMGFLDSFPCSDEHDCLYRCSSFSSSEEEEEEGPCALYTFYADLRQCWLLSGCGAVEEANCLDCATSHVDCDGDGDGSDAGAVCAVEDRCEGPWIASEDSPHTNECRLHCLEHDDCLYYSYDETHCSLSASCDRHYHDGVFAHWERTCPQANASASEVGLKLVPEDKLLVVGGLDSARGPLSTVEVVDLSGSGLACSAPDYPAAVHGAMINFAVDYSVLVCGGTDVNGTASTACNTLSSSNWTSSSTTPVLERAREGVAAVQLDRTRWWLTGGGLFELTSSAVLERGYADGEEAFLQGAELPDGLREHNLVSLGAGAGAGQAILLNGREDDDRVWLVVESNRSNFTFVEMEASNPSPRLGAFAGLATKSDGTRQLVFAGGYPYTEETWILELDREDPSVWTRGPDFPVPTYRGATVQYGFGFLAVGGEAESGEASGAIFRFDPGDAGGGGSPGPAWTRLAEDLQLPRSDFAAVIITEDYLSCS